MSYDSRLKLIKVLCRTIISKEKSERLFNRISNPLCITIEKYGDINPDDWYYFINLDKEYRYNGFCSLYKTILYMLFFAEYLGLTPFILIDKETMYYDSSISGENVFEYYFAPIGDMTLEELQHCSKVTVSKTDDVRVFGKLGSYDIPTDQEILSLSRFHKKYIHLNDKCKEAIFQFVEKHLNGVRTLGVHVRATDYKQGYNKHPVVVTPEEYLEATKEVMDAEKFDQVFLATDEESVIQIFNDCFGSRCLYYKDTFRSKDGNAIHYGENSRNGREHHKYLLGLEILRDVYTLAYCDGLIAGNSNVSFMARVISNSEAGGYEFCKILDKGINHNMKRVRSVFNNMLK